MISNITTTNISKIMVLLTLYDRPHKKNPIFK